MIFSLPHLMNVSYSEFLELWTSSYESLAEVVSCELAEVLDETCSEVFCFLLPLASARVGVAWVEDSWINARKLGWNLEVEVRNLLGWSLLD